MKSDFTAGIQAHKADKNSPSPKYMNLQELHKLFTYLENMIRAPKELEMN
ncbi:hypothetical protein P4534_24510 [Peribacillus butanolivorans]|nr:hypothetical protein [Peribacillus butanolivorans]